MAEDNPAPLSDDRIGRIFDETRAALADLKSAAVALRLSPDGTCPIFHRDNVVHAALPWADVDQLQRRLLTTRTPEDETLLTQLVDLLPSLAGRSLVDVGSFTGASGFMIAALMRPDVTHLFEPQSVMQEALGLAMEENRATCGPLVLHQTILDEAGAEMAISATPPARLSQTAYLRREGGPLRARAIDDLDLGRVGLIHLDFNNQKVPVLRGGMATLDRDRPLVLMDLTARDVEEARALVLPLGYRDVRMGRNAMIFLPT